MNYQLMKHAKKYNRKHRRKKLWQKLISVLGCMVMFFTIYSLILPAITMEKDLVCGIEEHQHDSSCYEAVLSTRQLVCTTKPHEHITDCYDAEGKLICDYADFYIHSHNRDCYQDDELVCTLPDIKSHTHTDECYEETTEYTCDLEKTEAIPHEHSESCFDANEQLACGYLEVLEHVHDDSCFEVSQSDDESVLVCENTEHLHSEACLEATSDDVTEEYIGDETTRHSIHLTYNEVKDAFFSDSDYSQYFNSNNPIGTAGSFHIVAFDTAYLNAHTNGNILAKNLYAGSNFGTNNLTRELSYVQNYKQVSSTSASSTDHILVIGSENTVDFVDNGNAFSINGTKIDRPYNLIQDRNTATAPFIDLNRVRNEISQVSVRLGEYSDANLIYTSSKDLNKGYNKLELTTPSGVGVVNYTATQLKEKLESYVQIDGFKSDSRGTVVINVDCAGVTEINMPQARVLIDGQLQETNEVTEFSAGKVIWNFINANGVTINTHLMTGIIVAPGATVNINHNLNGTVVADIVTVNAESHRTDFSGSVTEPDEDVEENEYYVTVQKIQTGYVGTTLAGAEFDLYKWENNDWVKVNTEALVTGERGTVMLRNLEASVAYKLVETKAPTGYVMKDGAFFFWVRTDKNQSQPSQCPSGFSGIMVEVGGTFLAANDKDVIVETTSLSIKKMWLAADGSDLKDITVESINVNVYQIADGDEENKKLYKTLTLSSAVNWMETLEDLPLTGTSSDGTRIYYTYTVEEVAVDGYTSSYETKDGSVTITNTKDETSGDDYTLPETGGRGTNYYTTSGVLIMEAALMWLWVERYKDERRAE